MVTGTLAKASAFVAILPCRDQASTFTLYNSSRGNSDPVQHGGREAVHPGLSLPFSPAATKYSNFRL